MTENEFKYWAFISHSQQDNGAQSPGALGAGQVCWGDWLRAELKHFPVPAELAGQSNARGEIIPDRLDSIFQDLTESPDNASLSENVRLALEQSRCLVVICSPRSAQSRHVNEVVRYFKQLGRGNRILPLVIAGEPHASAAAQPRFTADDECLVPALRHPLKPDGSVDTTKPERGFIFADARHGETKREFSAAEKESGALELETGKLQLIAGLLGVGFNGLWGRELKRRFAVAPASAPETASPISGNDSADLEPLRQIQELRDQVQAAQNQIVQAQHQAREVSGQVAEARQQAQLAENKWLEAQRQLEAAHQQIRVAEQSVLEKQNLPPDVKRQLQESQNKIQEAQAQASAALSQTEQARSEVREAQNTFAAVQDQVREAQSRVAELENQARQKQVQLDEARDQARAAEKKVQSAQQQSQLAQEQMELARNEARDVQIKLLDAQNRANAAQTLVQEVRGQSQTARRLTKILALLAALALMAAASIVLWQRKTAAQVAAKNPAAIADTNSPSVVLSHDAIPPALRKINSLVPDQNPLRRLEELAAQIPVGEIPGTLDLAATILEEPLRGRFQEQLLGYWIQTNSPAAFDWSCQLTNAAFRQVALKQIIPVLTTDSWTNTLARLNGLTPVPDKEVYRSLFVRWATKDPLEAIAQRQAIPGHDADVWILSNILFTWWEQQPAAAVSWLETPPDADSLPGKSWCDSILVELFQAWAIKDLEAATAACQQLPDGAAKDKVWECVLSQQILKAPATAAESVKNLPPGDYRQKAIAELCQHWTGMNAPNLLDWAQTLPSAAERMAVTNQFVIQWARQEPAAAAAFAGQSGELSSNALVEIASAWFPKDFIATTNWIASLPAGVKQDAAWLAVREPWSQRDPQSLMAFALALPAGDLQTQLLTAASQQLAVRDFPKTVELLQPLADAALRRTILEQAARACGLAQINSAAKSVAALPMGDDQKAAINGLLATWSPADPQAAVDWLAAFPETNSQPEPLQTILKTWSQSAPAAAAHWLANSAPGVDKEKMANAFLEGALLKYPAFAAQWTQSVTNESQRQQYQIQVARVWTKSDFAAATNWIEGLSLPDETKQSLKRTAP